MVKYKKSFAGLKRIMALNQIGGERFSAIAASSNTALQGALRDKAALRP